VIKGCSNLRKS